MVENCLYKNNDTIYSVYILKNSKYSIGGIIVLLINRLFFSNVDHPKVPGISIYFQGCDANPKCLNCHNPQTWSFEKGYTTSEKFLIHRVIRNLNLILESYDTVSLNFLGGEPLTKINRNGVRILSEVVKRTYKDKVIVLLYSWRRPVDIYLQGLLKYVEYVDEFVLGRYMEKYKNLTSGKIGFPASKNQLYLNREQFDNSIVKLIEKFGRDLHADYVQL